MQIRLSGITMRSRFGMSQAVAAATTRPLTPIQQSLAKYLQLDPNAATLDAIRIRFQDRLNDLEGAREEDLFFKGVYPHIAPYRSPQEAQPQTLDELLPIIRDTVLRDQ